MSASRFTYFTCQEILEVYSHVKLWGWNANKIGTFYNCLLLDGRKFGKGRTIITESSFVALADFVYQGLIIKDDQPIFLSYDEIIEEIPQAELYRWTPTIIGILYHTNLLKGKQCKKEGRNLITEQSAKRLIQFTSNRFNNMANL